MEKISAVYQIVNTITGDFYVGSSKNVIKRWAEHKRPSMWEQQSNSPLYKDMQKYGLDKFSFTILKQVKPESLKSEEQRYIDMLKPVCNDRYADGWDFKRIKEYRKEYQKSENFIKSQKKYCQTEKFKESQRRYRQSNKCKEVRKKAQKKYSSQLCSYSDETLTLNALVLRFRKAGISHLNIEAKKYLIK